MASLRGVITLSLLLVLLTASSSGGRDFVVVSGRDGWTTIPELYVGHFQLNDTIVFFNTHVDAVLWVSPSHYAACNTTQPLLRLDDGESHVVLNVSDRYYYFISADAGRCRDDKRITVDLAVRNKTDINTHSPVPPPLPPPPKPASSSAPPPTPVPSPTPPALPPQPPSPFAANVSSPSSAPLMSSAVALRADVLAACLVVGSAMILA